MRSFENDKLKSQHFTVKRVVLGRYVFPCSLQDFEMLPCSPEKNDNVPRKFFCQIFYHECTIYDAGCAIFAT